VAVQEKIPILDDVALYTVSMLLVVVVFNELNTAMYLLLLSDTFIITSLKYQLMLGTGSPVAMHVKFTVSLLSVLKSLISDMMTG